MYVPAIRSSSEKGMSLQMVDLDSNIQNTVLFDESPQGCLDIFGGLSPGAVLLHSPGCCIGWGHGISHSRRSCTRSSGRRANAGRNATSVLWVSSYILGTHHRERDTILTSSFCKCVCLHIFATHTVEVFQR